MEIEFIGYIATSRDNSVFDFPYIRDLTCAHERAGFDTVLIGYGPDSPDPLQIAAYAAAHSERIRMLVAHRAGVVFPTLAARMIATLDHITNGRISLNLVPGGTNDADPRREGDYLPKEQRYARTGEYLQVLKAAWTADSPISHIGDYYHFEDYRPRVRPLQRPWVPLFLAGSSVAGQIAAGRHADTYAFYGEPLSGTAELISSVRQAAAEAGRVTKGLSARRKPRTGSRQRTGF
jgi:alkanesulfonate monooxygenase